MNQIQIEIVKSQFAERTGKGFFQIVIAHFLNIRFGGDEQLLPGHCALQHSLSDGRAYRFFIFIGAGGVNEAVAGANGVQHHFLAHRLRNLEHPEALLGHLHTIVQLDSIHTVCPPLLHSGYGDRSA